MESFCQNLSVESQDEDILRLDWSEQDETELMAIINCKVFPLSFKTNKIKVSSSRENTVNIPAAMKDRLSINPDKSLMKTVKELKPGRSQNPYRHTRKVCELNNICDDILRLDWSEGDDAELMALVNCNGLSLPSTTNRIKLSVSPADIKSNIPDAMEDDRLRTNSDKSKTENIKKSKSYRSHSPYRHKRKVCKFLMQGHCKFGNRCYNFHPDRLDESEFRYKRKRSPDNENTKERSRSHNTSRNSSEYGTKKRTRDYSRSSFRSRDRSCTNKKRKVH